MVDGRRLIGVCVSHITEFECAEFLHALYLNTRNTDSRIIVFNTYAEMYGGNKEPQLEKTIFRTIDYESLDVLLIADQCFANKKLVERLITEAKKHHLPVVVLEREYEGCFAVLPTYADTFTELIKHLINAHGARRLKYLAGKSGEFHSELRKTLFVNTLEECGITADDRDISYCDYWEGPVMREVDRWVKENDVPDAVVCANDVMAAAACKQLSQYGLRVPQDVLVTGFDGLDFYAFHRPVLTTCKRNTNGLANLAFSVVQKAMNGEEPSVFIEPYLLEKGESCGCETEFDLDSVLKAANRSNELLLDSQIHEKQVFTLLKNVLENTEIDDLNACLSPQLLNGSAVCLFPTFVDFINNLDSSRKSYSLTERAIIASANDEALYQRVNDGFPLSEMYPALSSVIHEDGMYLLQDLFAETELCGFYAVRTGDVLSVTNRMHRIVNVLNGTVSLLSSRMKQKRVSENMLEMRWHDGLTGLLNLKGIAALINEQYDALKDKYISLSVYTLPQYQFICENFGLGGGEDAVRFAAESLKKVNPSSDLIARIENDRFMVIHVGENEQTVFERTAKAVDRLRLCFAEYNQDAGQSFHVDFYNGSTVVEPGWKNDLLSLMKAADSELYLNRLKQNNVMGRRDQKTSGEDYRLLDLLLKKNLFQYHFQPIVSARTGEICAYEALMRTGEDIKLSPLEILRIAQEHFRLYDVERATMNNVMSYVEQHFDLFKGKRVYINSIPGFFLQGEDRENFIAQYSHLFNMCTIEITERSEFTDESEIQKVFELSDGKNGCQLAIDDYGAGFSNIVNLLRYSPNVIKIDHFLIEDIQNDSNKQMFVKNTIEFARMNRIAILAEGVETYQELKKLIELGVDYIQGYYTARPSPVVIQEIDSLVKNQIIEENLKNVRIGNEVHVYYAKNNEKIHLLDLALKKYTSIEVHGEKVRIVGEKNHPIDMVVKIADGSKCVLELENVNMIGPNETTIQLGFDTNCRIMVCGDCVLQKEGISVPVTSSLEICGDGNLTVQHTRNNGVAIGASSFGTFGSIEVDMGGELKIFSNGDQVVCIGGGFGGDNAAIRLIRGKVYAETRSIFGVAIGSRNGWSNLRIEKDAQVEINCAGNELIGIGTEEGTLDALIDGQVQFYGEGDKVVGIGALTGGTGHVEVTGNADIVGKGSKFVGIGSLTGGIDVNCHADRIRIYSEGETVCGMGSPNGYGTVKITRGIISIDMLAAERLYIGGNDTPVIIDGGNVYFDPDAFPITAKNSLGQPLRKVELQQAVFSRHICNETGEYDYQSSRDEKTGLHTVYLPCEE